MRSEEEETRYPLAIEVCGLAYRGNPLSKALIYTRDMTLMAFNAHMRWIPVIKGLWSATKLSGMSFHE